jgi:hypothetical protein
MPLAASEAMKTPPCRPALQASRAVASESWNEFIGREEARRFYAIVAARPGRRRLVQTRANGQPALAFYARDNTGGVFRATSLMVVTLSGERIAALTRFDPSVLQHFGLPRILPE